MTYTLNGSDTALVTGFVISYLISMLVSMGVTALMMVSKWHIFKKLGMPGWKGIIPFYSDYMLFRTVWITKPFWVLVVAAGVYTMVSMITAILMPVLVLLTGNTLDDDEMITLLIVFGIIFGLLTLTLSVIALIIKFRLNIRLASVFGKGVGFVLGLTFISVVFYPILAFGKSQKITG